MIVADVLGRGDDRGPHDRLVDICHLAPGVLAGVGDRDLGVVFHLDPVHHVGCRRDQVQVELALKPLPHDLHVQQAQEPAPEAEAQGTGGLRFVHERGVVELQLVEGITQVRVVVAVHREEPGVDHRIGMPVPAQRLGGRAHVGRDGVADARLPDLLDSRDEVADLADADVAGLGRFRRDDADLEHLVDGSGGHHLDPVAMAELAIDHADVGDDATVGVVDGVEDQGTWWCIGDPLGSGYDVDDLVEQGLHTLARLRRDVQHVVDIAADDVRDLGRILLRLRTWQVDLVEHRDDVEIGVQRQIEVGQRLRLDALRSIDEQHGALTRLERPAHLVGEVDVPGSVDHVEHEGLTRLLSRRDRPRQPDRLTLDGDAALPLDVHPVQVLRARRPLVDDTRQLQHPVRQRRLAMVDVGDDAEVADDRRIGVARLRRGAGLGHWLLSGRVGVLVDRSEIWTCGAFPCTRRESSDHSSTPWFPSLPATCQVLNRS